MHENIILPNLSLAIQTTPYHIKLWPIVPSTKHPNLTNKAYLYRFLLDNVCRGLVVCCFNLCNSCLDMFGPVSRQFMRELVMRRFGLWECGNILKL